MTANDPHVENHGRIVVGVDGSDSSKEALRWAAAQAQRTGAVLEAVTTWQVPSAAYGYGVPLTAEAELRQGAQAQLARTLTEVLGAHPAVEVSAMTVEGPAAATLVRESKGAELLVVGSRGHGTFVGMMLGSVSEHCVTHAHCPVVVLHQHDQAV